MINLVNTSNTRITDDLKSHMYLNDRLPGRGTFIDKSTFMGGKQCLTNRLQCMIKINFDWISVNNPDNLRKLLKQTFILFYSHYIQLHFPYSLISWHINFFVSLFIDKLALFELILRYFKIIL